MNKIIKHHLKMHLEKYGGAWLRELPYVLWAIRTKRKTSTLFSLAFGMKAVAATEVRLSSFRVEQFKLAHNKDQMRYDLDMVEEKKETS